MSTSEAAASAESAAPADRETLYTAVVTAADGRHGRVESADGRLVADLSYPRAMGGDGGPGTNPEQLFAAGFAAMRELTPVTVRMVVDAPIGEPSP